MLNTECSDVDVMHEFIKLRNYAEQHLVASLRFADIENKLISKHYDDAYYAIVDINFTLKGLSVLSISEYENLSSLSEILKSKAKS